MNIAIIDELQRRQILGIVEAALRNADVIDVIPTPLDAVAKSVEIGDVVDISQLPEAAAVHRPSMFRRVLGAILFRERTVFVDLRLPEPRRRFTQGHEIGHGLIPWHAASFRLDDESTLMPETKELLEAEASLAAGHLLFQGPRTFMNRALDFKVGIEAPMAVAATFGASIHATLRYYAEHLPEAAGLIITGKFESVADGSVPVWSCVESPTFRRRYGRLIGLFPEGTARIAGGDGKPFGDILHASHGVEAPRKTVVLRDRDGEPYAFEAEAFFNGVCHFVLLTEHRALRLGRRVHVETTEATA